MLGLSWEISTSCRAGLSDQRLIPGCTNRLWWIWVARSSHRLAITEPAHGFNSSSCVTTPRHHLKGFSYDDDDDDDDDGE